MNTWIPYVEGDCVRVTGQELPQPLKYVLIASALLVGCRGTTGRMKHGSELGARACMYPAIELSNDLVTARVFLPDASRGYYRGSRFDWSGLVGQVRYEGHTYFSGLDCEHDPNNNNEILGTAEEFGMGINGLPPPLGYEQAAPGETFLKIGVGLLEKIEERW